MYFIYKITNLLNNKIYIGKVYNKTIYDRFNRHCKEASPNHKQYIDRAINKYGKENFSVELVEEISNSELTHSELVKLLNEREIHWIKYFNSTNLSIGYNLTNGGDGGNTYLNKTVTELNEIKHKISIANTGVKNAMAKSIKALNVVTNEIYFFDTVNACLKFLNIKHKESVTDICNCKSKTLYKNTWNFAYTKNSFNVLETNKKRTHFGKQKCYLIDKETNTKTLYLSISEARKNSNLKQREKENYKYKIIDIL